MLALLLSGAYAANNTALFKCKEKKKVEQLLLMVEKMLK